MSNQGGFWLEPTSVLLVTRQGGFVVAPGLSAPRRIDCQELSEPQRRKLQAVLEELDQRGAGDQHTECQCPERQSPADSHPGSQDATRRSANPPAGVADGRWFHVTLEISSGFPSHEWELDERAAPRSLIGLWKRGVQVLDESDD
ncbi:protealysin inhibitor emfourin [Salinicola halimionae]|uniref:protealysin inhibitor emfourin n=1 Tax=Salinicola halimionae TaxID=1949081 RepID=UPI0013003B9D|nr:protealysin inhibitor emfourin [Salinicola halimionae]